MSDLISRQAAIDAIDEIESEIAEGFGFEYEKWRKYFCDLPPAQPEQRWIPCTPDTMPDDYTDVLVWFEYYRYGDYNCLYQTYGIGSYSTEYDSWMINHETGWRKLRVLAYMPLPEPYGGD